MSKLSKVLLIVFVFIVLYTIVAVVLECFGVTMPDALTNGVFGLATGEGILCCIIKVVPDYSNAILEKMRFKREQKEDKE